MFTPQFIMAGAEGARTVRALGILLAALTAWNVDLMSQGGFPALYETRIRYQRERAEDWRDALEVARRLRGDCEDLCCYRAAELQLAGEVARAVAVEIAVPREDGRLFHILVRRGDGSFEDPSRILGMH